MPVIARATIKDVAKVAGVSHMTVARALKDSVNVTEATKEKVLSACKALNYRHNLIASQLRNANFKSRIIAVILPALQHSYYTNILKYLEEECRKYNYHVMIYQMSIDKAVASTWNDLDFLLARRIDGLVIFAKLQSEITNRLKSEMIPMVFVDFKPDDRDLAFIGTMDFEGEKEITEYLISLGHRKIAFIGGPKGHFTSDHRLSGYLAALKAGGLRPKTVHAPNMRVEDGFASMKSLLEKKMDFTALAAANDYLAMGVISCCASRKIRIPEDLSLTGFAGVEEDAYTVPPLTSMEQQMETIGRKAFQMIKEMEADPSASRQEILLPAKLVIRNSCMPYKA